MSLTRLLEKVVEPSSPKKTKSETDVLINLQKASLNKASQQLNTLGDTAGCLMPQHATNASRSRYLEWGAVDFDDLNFPRKRLSNPNNRHYTLQRTLSGSQSSPSSSVGTPRYPSQIFSSSHLQSTISLEGGGQSISSGHRSHPSDSSIATHDYAEDLPTNNNGISSTENILKLMEEHDKTAFSSNPKVRAKSSDISQSLINDGVVSPGSPILKGRSMLRSQSALFLSALNNKGGGIGSALDQYDGGKQRKRDTSTSPGASLVEYNATDDAAGGQSTSLTLSPLSIGMHLSLDRRNEGLRPSVLRLVAPDAIPRYSRLGSNNNTGDRFMPLDSSLRRKSFHVNQKTRPYTDNRSNLGNVPLDSSQRRKSFHVSQKTRPYTDNRPNLGDKPKEYDHKAGKKVKPEKLVHRRSSGGKSKQQRHRTHRNRRKQWVLNPFRQEDEDEVLAKRTHNRRRWSHVFPLGEDEFKRHAGPNWKSLCQPAIRKCYYSSDFYLLLCPNAWLNLFRHILQCR